MAAPLRRPALTFKITNLKKLGNVNGEINRNVFRINKQLIRNYSQSFKSKFVDVCKIKWKTGVCIAVASSVFATGVTTTCYASAEPRPVSRQVKGLLNIGEQKLTLYQFQSCPYCCKVRAALDYFGFAYDVVEVNSVTKKQMKFSEYKKVPVLVVDGKMDNEEFTLQFNDSSSIVSALGTFVYYDQKTSLPTLHTYYPGFMEKQGRKTVWDFPNKYFIMNGEGDGGSTQTETQRKDERKWRKWVDEIFMHTISPNVYRTPSESLEAFHHFSEWGEWDKNFSTVTRLGVVYIGAVAMYFIGKIIKKRYNIKENPRESLYDACDEWMKAIGDKKYLGNNQPNLADLALYGAMHSFEGCRAHVDLMASHRVKDWYRRMEQQINGHQGAFLSAEQ